MLKDFLVADSVGIRAGTQYADLHNSYDLAQLRLNCRGSMVEIEFRVRQEMANDSLAAAIVLEFSNVDWFQTSSGVVSLDGIDVTEIGYKEPTDRDHHWLLSEGQGTPEAHLFFRLTNDEFIRIHARWVQAVFKAA